MIDLHTFYERSFARLLCASPEVAAELGIRAVGATPIPQDRFSDASPAGAAARRELMAATLAQLRALPGPPDLNREIYEFFLRWANFGQLRGSESAEHALCGYVADHLGGAQAEVITCLAQWQVLASDADADAYLARAAAIPGVIDGLIESLRVRVPAGNVMSACIVRRVQTEIAKLLACAPDEHPLVARLAPGYPQHALALRPLVQGPIASAYQRLQDYFSEYPMEARIGLERMPGGREYYAFLLKAHTTTELSAEQIHELGKRELSRLQQALNARLDAAGFASGNLAQRLADFDARQKLDLGDTTDPRAELMRLLQEILEDAERLCLPLFGIKPRAGVMLREIPQLQEPNRHNTYIPPAEDGSRPGVFEVQVSQLLAGTRWDLYNLIYHEAMPGHHLQLTIAQELGAGLPSFRRVLVHDAYIEGWAKYSELLPWLEHLNTEPLWDIARSRFEIYSTANLVLDTGIHHYGWSREQALAFVTENTGGGAAFADYMVDRIAARPAQACSYKIGMLTVLGARERMRSALGAHFDLRAFHDTILGQGSVPLAMLDRIVDQKIARLSTNN